MVRHRQSTGLLGQLWRWLDLLEGTALPLAMELRLLATARRLRATEPLRQAMVRRLQVMGLLRRAMGRLPVTVLLLLAMARRHPGTALPVVPRVDRHLATGHHLDMGLLPATGHLRQATGLHQVLEGLPQVTSLDATLAE